MQQKPRINYKPDLSKMGREVFEELAGKYEYDAGMTRQAAEARAAQDAKDYMDAYRRSH